MNAIFAAPILSENAMRVITAATRLDGVRLGVIAQDPAEKLAGVEVTQHWRVDDVLNVEQLEWAVQNVAARMGGVDVLFAAYEQLQVPIAQMREKFGIGGMRAEAARNFRDKARMKELFDAAGLPCARHARVGSDEDAGRFASANGYPLVYKPIEGVAARSTFRVDTRQYAAGIAFLRGQGEGRVKAIHRVEEATREIGPLVVAMWLPAICQAPVGGYEGEGFIIVRHRETAVVEQALQTIVDLIRVELG